MAALFVFGTLWFWLLFAFAVIAVGAFVANDRFGKATFSLIAFFALLYFFGDFNVLKWIWANAAMVAISAGAYFLAGTGWAVAKWWFFVRRMRERYDERKLDFLRQHGVEGAAIPDQLKRRWIESFHYSAHEFGLERTARGYEFPPKARSFKSKIVSWMIYWPWSMVVTVIDDPIRKLFRAIYARIQGMLQRMSDRAFAGTEGDLTDAPPAPANDAPPSGNGSHEPRRQGSASFRGDDLTA